MMEHIGYESKVVFKNNPTIDFVIVSNNFFFITGFIPYAPTNARISFEAKYANSSAYRNYLNNPNNTPFIVMFNSKKVPIAQSGRWDMTDHSGKRTVSSTTSDFVNNIAYVRFSGYLPDIDECYLKDNNTGKVIWTKNM